MKFIPMERAGDTGGNPTAEKTRHGIAVAFACAVHGFLFFVFSFVPEKPMAIPTVPIPVKLVILDIPPPADLPEAVSEPPASSPPPPEPVPDPLPVPDPQPDPVPEQQPPARSQIETLPGAAPPPQSPPLTILSTEDPEVGEPIPDRWRLPDGARIPLENTRQARNPNLEALSKSLDCLGFNAECAAQRKSVFAEDQLSGTDLVWMRSYAHSGLSDSSLYGLSEAQIRERLGIPTAGKNGFMLLPGIMIDGPWWDALHGVNKACEYGLGFNDLGEKQLMKRCDPGKPSSKDRIGFTPKAVE